MGHRVVALIAQRHISPIAQRRFRLLFRNGTSMADTASWADEIREPRPETASWHYINIPPTATKLDLKRDCPSDDCITFQIRKAIAIARLGIRDELQRQEAVKFLVHLMGDLHQPLHAGHNHDRGGNEILVLYQGKETNLHAFWDSDLVRHTCDDEAACAEKINRSITAEQKKKWQQGRLNDWTWESHLLAVRVAYGALPSGSPKQLTGDYVRPAAAVVEEQLAKAGVRLAQVINEIWGH